MVRSWVKSGAFEMGHERVHLIKELDSKALSTLIMLGDEGSLKGLGELEQSRFANSADRTRSSNPVLSEHQILLQFADFEAKRRATVDDGGAPPF